MTLLSLDVSTSGDARAGGSAGSALDLAGDRAAARGFLGGGGKAAEAEARGHGHRHRPRSPTASSSTSSPSSPTTPHPMDINTDQSRPAAPTASTQASGGKNAELGKDQFLKLFVAQLQHQDPMNPMQDQDFMGQMASFSDAGAGDQHGEGQRGHRRQPRP